MQLSIVIPTYNCAEYIDNTLHSVVSQLPEDCEAIVVDDGSTDATRARLRNWMGCENVRVLFREHRGVSAARNAGLDAARGEFVTFLDCDDRIAEGFFAQALPLREAADLYIFSIERLRLDGGRETWTVPDSVYEDAAAFADAYIRNRHLLIYSAANKLYRRRILEQGGLRFDESRSFGEDRDFNYRYLAACGRVVTSKLLMFQYRERGGSLSTRHVPDMFTLAMGLHREKMQCFFALSKGTTEDERIDFEAYDAAREIENTVARFAEHPEEVAENLPAINRLIFGEEHDGGLPVDILIVMGSRNCGYRVEQALAIGRKLPGVRYIVSGGNLYRDGKRTEAAFMADCLREQGVAPQCIYIEDRARWSQQNLEYCAPIVRAIRASDAEQGSAPVRRTGIVTAGFHVPRVRLMAERTAALSGEELVFFPAYGPKTAPDLWYRDPEGRTVVLDEYRKLIKLQRSTDEFNNS